MSTLWRLASLWEVEKSRSTSVRLPVLFIKNAKLLYQHTSKLEVKRLTDPKECVLCLMACVIERTEWVACKTNKPLSRFSWKCIRVYGNGGKSQSVKHHGYQTNTHICKGLYGSRYLRHITLTTTEKVSALACMHAPTHTHTHTQSVFSLQWRQREQSMVKKKSQSKADVKK